VVKCFRCSDFIKSELHRAIFLFLGVDSEYCIYSMVSFVIRSVDTYYDLRTLFSKCA
jgi:hypothetical protein